MSKFDRSPCLNCSKRKYNCHASCPDYREFRVFKDKENEMRKSARRGDGRTAGLESALRRDLNNRRIKYGTVK